ncbi:MAG: thiamine pyrophosphate-dependent enzyme, partial [Methanomicrobiaceae archaeon]|nr:thiamine pyrophosphate-dependent enzyme [Methanomicrobiaceae archaeon]
RYDARGYYRTFCRECPFAGVMETLSGRGMKVICDTGCSLFAINPPYSVGLAGYGLGSSVAVAATSTGVALTGDYALLHSGINALVDVYERRIPVLCIVLKNNRMGMTGGQPAYDVMRYLRWADPTVCSADDADTLDEVLVMPEAPCTVVIEGRCPEGGQHETVAC